VAKLMMGVTPTTVEIIVRLNNYYKDYGVVIKWLKHPNAHLGMATPLTLIREGREKKVLDFIIKNAIQ
jgi:hypothetical protein